jgi:hypothetical protein
VAVPLRRPQGVVAAGSRLVVETELSVDALAMILALSREPPALVEIQEEIQDKARELRALERDAFERARAVFDRPV